MNNNLDILIAAGGLGTRVQNWSSLVPKEFMPYNGQPGIIQLFNEINNIKCNNIWYIYHPYYKEFIAWFESYLVNKHYNNYNARLVALGKPEMTFNNLTYDNLNFCEEIGIYSDISSIMTVKQKIENKLLICFADDMFPELDTSSFASCKSNTVLASRLDINSNERRGIIVAKTIENNLYIDHIVEKPSKELLQELIVRFGVENLYCLEGRFILDKEFLNSINISQCMVGKEPKLSMAINNYAKNNLVNIFVYSGECLDLGSL